MLDKALPHNDDAERATLGAILLDRDAIVPLAAFLQPEHFYSQAHAWIYEAALACYNDTRHITPPDLTTVSDRLRRAGRLERIGGVPFLIDLSNAVPTAYHVEYYGRIVERTAILRRLIRAGGTIAALGYDETEDVEAVLESAEQEIFAVSERRNAQTTATMAQMSDDYYRHLERVQDNPDGVLGLPTGFVDFDRMTGGLYDGELLLLAARPGVGKSALAMNVAYNVAETRAEPVGVFALEMSRHQLYQRMLAAHVGIDSQRLRSGKVTESELAAIMSGMSHLSTLPIYVDDTPGLTVSELRAKARRMQAEHGLRLLVIDYLQLMSGSGKHDGNRVQEVSEISRGLKILARELHIPVIALSQLSRAVEGRQSKVPVLADLRESGSLEQDADAVYFIYREEMYDKDTDKKGIAEVHIAKSRNGPLGVVNLFFDQRVTRFRTLAPYHSPDGY